MFTELLIGEHSLIRDCFIESHWGYLGLIIVWVIGVCIDLSTCTIKNTKFHDGGFLGLGWTTHDNRELITQDIWFSFIWPLRALWSLVKAFLMVSLIVIATFCLAFGLNIKKYGFYNTIDRWTLD